jgi:DNA-directed RNA polymerase
MTATLLTLPCLACCCHCASTLTQQTAALHGADKLSFDEREAYCNEHIDQVRDSAEHPLDGNRWWAQSDDPWQCLAACMEVTAAIDRYYTLLSTYSNTSAITETDVI